MLRCAGGEAQRGECAVSAASALVLMSSTTTSSQHVGFAQTDSCQRNPIVLFANLQN